MKHFTFFLFGLILVGCSSNTYPPEQQVAVTEIISQSGTLNETQNMNIEIDIPSARNTQPQDSCFLFDDFTDTPDNRWGIINDGVMGGKSLGNGNIQNDALVFSGTIVTRGGGFSSLRGTLESGILADYNSVKLRAKSDGREYRITFRDNQWGNISHQLVIPFKTPGEFEEITVSFNDLQPAYFGRIVSANPFEKESAREIGVILSDGVDGAFTLEIDEVRFCK